METLEDIQRHIAELQQKAEEMRRQELASVIADIKDKMATYGISIEDLTKTKGPRKTGESKVKAKYRDPATGKQWTGRGVMPRWMKDALENGASKEDYLIE